MKRNIKKPWYRVRANKRPHCDILSEKMFIISPADVDTHRKVKLQDAEVLDKYKEEFEKLCEEYNDI